MMINTTLNNIPLSAQNRSNNSYDDVFREAQLLMWKMGGNIDDSINDFENWYKNQITEDDKEKKKNKF